MTGLAGISVLGTVALWKGRDANDLRIERHILSLPRWDASGIRIAVLSDLHANRKHQADRAIRAIHLAQKERPDVVVLPGDFLNYDWPSQLANLDRVLGALNELTMPVLASMGNHDYWVGDPANIIKRFEASNARLLRNEVFEYQGVTFCGVDDGIARRDRHDFLGPHQERNVVAMFHEPDMVTKVDPRISLMVAGHSHGGEVCLPGNIPMYAPKYGRRYIAGYYAGAKVPLYVTRGVGNLKTRVFCPPEVSILTLNPS